MIYCVLVIRQQNSFIGLALMLIFVIGETQALGVAVCCGGFFSESVSFTCFLEID